MTDTTDNLVIEMLKGLRGELKEFRSRYEEDMDDLKARMTSLESSMVGVKREINHADETDARQQVSLDKLAKRIERIEHRLELA